MKRLELSDFEPYINTTFLFSQEQDGIMVELLLTSVKAQQMNPDDMRVKDTSGKYRSQVFSLFFEGIHSERLRQKQYTVTHPAFSESMQIFITCLGPNEKRTGFIYEAVFG